MRRIIASFLFIIMIAGSVYALDPVAMFGKPWEQLSREQRREFWNMRITQTFEPSGKPSIDRLDFYIHVFQEKNIFDPKVVVFDVNAVEHGGTITLTGEALYPNHKSGVERVLNILGFDKIDNKIKILPDPALFPLAFAVAAEPVVSVSRNPGDMSEQLNQVLKGDPLRLLKQDESGKFFLIQGPDAYIGWVNGEKIKRMNIEDWAKICRIEESDEASRQKITDIVKPVMGVPYVWGGLTEDGMDCSGFTSYIYRKRGIMIPRDADQQSNVGKLVGFPGYRHNLRAGDLLYFAGGTGRISHVAISLGGDEYLQSVGSDGVHKASFDPDSPLYMKKTDDRFITARRIFLEGF